MPASLVGLLGTAAFAVAARALRGATNSGALTGFFLALLLYLCGGPPAFLLLVTLFALTYIATRIGYARKQHRGLAEPREGRNAWQVLANIGVAAACALAYRAFGSRSLLLACTAAMAEAAADTVSSEIGQAYRPSARLITTGRIVPPGTNGGVTVSGTLAGVAAALVVSAVGALAGVIPWIWTPAAALAATLGMVFDSLLGAVFEDKGVLDNNAVNFLGTLAAAVLAFALKF